MSAPLARPRLVNRLHAAVGNGGIVLQAPAGFGKTTLLLQFAADLQDHFRVRWVPLDKGCQAREVFAERIARAIHGGTFPPAPTAARTDDLKAYLSRLLNDDLASSPLPLLLILDNAHELAASEDCLELADWLVQGLPEGIELVVSGRRSIALAELDRRVTGGEALLLGRDDLTFTPGEIAEILLRQDRQFDVETVLKATDGWPIGVAALVAGAALPANGRKLEAGAVWERYLANEIWEAVPADLRPSLLALSIPQAIEPGIGDLLLGESAWERVHGWLQSHDELLLEPSVDGTFRLNPLLRRFLIARFRATDSDGFNASGAAVLRTMEAEGAYKEAVALAIEVKLRSPLAALLERHGPRFLLEGAYATLTEGMKALPKARLASSSAMLTAIHARALAQTGHPADALSQADLALGHPGATPEARVHAHLGRQRAMRMFGRLEEMVETVHDIQRLAPLVRDPWVLGEIAYAEAEIEGIAAGNLVRAEECLRTSIRHSARAQARVLELFARSTLGQCLAMRGDAPAAVAELVNAAQGWREVPGNAHLGVVLNNLGMSYCLVGDFESALPTLTEALAEARACGNERNEAFAVASLGDAAIALARYDEARKHYEEAIRLCAEAVTDESLAAQAIAGLAAAYLGLGDIKQADYFAQRAWWIAHERCGPLEQAICLQQQARVCAAAGETAEAIRFFQDAIEDFELADARASLAGARYGLAACYFRSRNRATAETVLARLHEGLTSPWMLGGLMPFVRQDPLFAEWAASRHGAPASFKAAIAGLVRTPLATPEGPAPHAFPDVRVASLGGVHVTVDGREVNEDAWESVRAKELFFLFLANREGIRKEDAVEKLYPDLPREKCNSAFHSNIYRIRRALYQDSIVRKGGAYLLNPDGRFEWDVEAFEDLLERARALPSGSGERAQLCREAVERYRGPFAEIFYSEWAEALRRRLEARSLEAVALIAAYHAARGEFEVAASCIERLFDQDHFNDQAAYELAVYRARSGNILAALGHLDSYRTWYRDEVGSELPNRFQVLRARIAAGAAV